jgi:hypothetical protein
MRAGKDEMFSPRGVRSARLAFGIFITNLYVIFGYDIVAGGFLILNRCVASVWYSIMW